jgi:hypothetical protein
MAMGKYTHEEYLRISKLSARWYVIHAIVSVVLMICFIALFTLLLHGLYLGICSLLPLEGSWYFQHYSFFILPALLLAFPVGPLAAYGVMRMLKPADYDKILDLMNVKSKFDGIACFKWVLRGCAIATAVILPFICWSYMSVKEDGVTVKDVFALKAKHYNYSDFGPATHYERSYDFQKGVYPNEHYRLILKDGTSPRTLISDNPFEYQKKIVEMGRLSVIYADVDR